MTEEKNKKSVEKMLEEIDNLKKFIKKNKFIKKYKFFYNYL